MGLPDMGLPEKLVRPGAGGPGGPTIGSHLHCSSHAILPKLVLDRDQQFETTASEGVRTPDLAGITTMYRIIRIRLQGSCGGSYLSRTTTMYRIAVGRTCSAP